MDRNEPKKSKIGISGSTLKMIAIVTMLIDHIGATILARMLMSGGLGSINSEDASAVLLWVNQNGRLFWIYQILRQIGRIAFPIFCFLLVQGFEHTHDKSKYAVRLGIFALLSEIPFDLAFNSVILEYEYQNVFFTLFIGLLTMMGYHAVEENKMLSNGSKTLLYIIVVIIGMLVAEALRTDYAAMGVFCIMILYAFRQKKAYQITAGCLSFLWEIPAPLAFIPIGFYNGKRGWKMKYFFYIFYPAHLLLLYFVAYSMGLSGYAAV